jgi:hypothetical protein
LDTGHSKTEGWWRYVDCEGEATRALYAYAAGGDVATVQAGNLPNSPVISPVGSVTFTVEK